jgi:ABC-2 type transport system ATP-binding protein
MSDPLLQVRDLKRWFDQVHAVDGVSFDLTAGQVVGLIGANGAGKTTLMRILATLDVPDEGTVLLDGRDIVQYPNLVRSKLGWMPDYFSAYINTTVRDYLDFFARAYGMKGLDVLHRVDEVIEFTELGELADRPMDKLSKGQNQRLCLARTLLSNPAFLILDEPAAGLDPKARLEFKNLVRILRDQGKTILISSHILSELAEMCDSLVFMDAGRIVHQGDAESLQHDNKVEGVVFAITVHGPTDTLVQWLAVRPGWKLVEEQRDGARALFAQSDHAAIAEELKHMIADGVCVIEFERIERRLEEAFVDLLKNEARNHAGKGRAVK